MKIGIIGCAADKFTSLGEERAKKIIRDILTFYKSRFSECVIVSGRCPLGGVDIWVEEEAESMGMRLDVKAPKQLKWNAEYGYKQRNIDIAKDSDMLHVVVAATYPFRYVGERFPGCYHCNRNDHVRSGACWTANKFGQLHGSRKAVWWLVGNG